jgi:hypothetical protein
MLCYFDPSTAFLPPTAAASDVVYCLPCCNGAGYVVGLINGKKCIVCFKNKFDWKCVYNYRADIFQGKLHLHAGMVDPNLANARTTHRAFQVGRRPAWRSGLRPDENMKAPKAVLVL